MASRSATDRDRGCPRSTAAARRRGVGVDRRRAERSRRGRPATDHRVVESVRLGAVVQRGGDVVRRVRAGAPATITRSIAAGCRGAGARRGRRPRRAPTTQDGAHRKSGPCSSRHPPLRRRHRALAPHLHHDAHGDRDRRRRAARAGRPSSTGESTTAPDRPEGVATWPAGVRRSIDGLVEAAGRGGSTRPRSRRAARRTSSSQPRIALVGKHRLENVQTKCPPGRSTRRDVAEHLDRPHEVVDRHAAHRGVERLVGERQRGSALRSCTTRRRRLRVGGELRRVHPEHREVRGRAAEVRHPRAHEVEHVAVDAELVVERADRGDRAVVDVGDQAREPVERVVGAGVGAVEEPGGKPSSSTAGHYAPRSAGFTP